jgi:hypothetical protein
MQRVTRITAFRIKDAAFGVDHDPRGRFWNSRWNPHREVPARQVLPETVMITDSAIREVDALEEDEAGAIIRKM